MMWMLRVLVLLLLLVGRSDAGPIGGGGMGGASGGGAGALNTSTGDAPVTNSTDEVTLYTYDLPGSVLGSSKCAAVNVLSTLTGNNAGVLTIRGKYGAAGVATVTFTPPAITTELTTIALRVCGDGTTTTQKMTLAVNAGATSIEHKVEADLTETSTSTLALAVTAQWDTASEALTLTKTYAETVAVGGASWLEKPGAPGLLKTIDTGTTTAVATPDTDYATPDALNAHINDTTAAHAGTAISNTPAGGIAATTVQAAIDELDTEKATATALTAHIDDPTAAHAGTAISNTPAGGIAATTVQAAIDELDSEKATAAALTAHIDDTTAAHAGTAISNTPAGGIAATTVQAALNELDTEKVAATTLSTPGTINQSGNPVDWTQLKNVPAGFADGTDDGGSGGSAGPLIDLTEGGTGGFRDHTIASILAVDEATKTVTFSGPIVTPQAGNPVLITPIAAVGTKKICAIGNDGVATQCDDVQPIAIHGPPSAGSCTIGNEIFIDDTTTPKALYFCTTEGGTPIDVATVGDAPISVCADGGLCGTFTGASQLDIIAGNAGIATTRVQSAANHVQLKVAAAFLTDATSCPTNVTTAVLGQQCTDLDDNTAWVCVNPSWGGNSSTLCDTADEWGVKAAPVSTWSAVMAQGHVYGQAVDIDSGPKVGNDTLGIYETKWADADGFHTQITPAQNFSMQIGTGKSFTFYRNDGTTSLWNLTEAGALTGGAALAIDNTSVTSIKPFKSGTARPGTCAAGEMFFDTDETAGKNIYGCTASNTWTLQGDGNDGGGGGYAALVQTAGNMILTPQTADGIASLQIYNAAGTTKMLSLGSYNGAGTGGAIYFGTNTGTNGYALTGNTTQTIVNAPSGGTGYLDQGGVAAAAWSTALFAVPVGSKFTFLAPNNDVAMAHNAAGVMEINNYTAGQFAELKVGKRDAGTNTVLPGLTIHRQSSGTPAAGLGSELLYKISSSTTVDQDAAAIDAVWTTATHASRTADLVFKTVNNAAALAETARLPATGGLKLATGTQPTCDATTAGTLYYTAGGAGALDKLEICRKDVSDSYAYVSLF